MDDAVCVVCLRFAGTRSLKVVSRSSILVLSVLKSYGKQRVMKQHQVLEGREIVKSHELILLPLGRNRCSIGS